MTDIDHALVDAERRHEGPSFWVSTSLDALIACEAEFVPDSDDDEARRILAELRAEIARRQQALREAGFDA